MPILITGVTGYLGSHLARACISAGFQVTGVKRSSSNLHRITDLLPNLALINSDADQLQQQLKQYDCIIHCATCYGRHAQGATEIRHANFDWPLLLLENAVAAGVKQFINIDSILPPTMNAYALSKNQFAQWGQLYFAHSELSFLNVKTTAFLWPRRRLFKIF